MSLKPKKFLYEESEYFGNNYFIELTKYGLELKRSTVSIPFTNGSYIFGFLKFYEHIETCTVHSVSSFV